MAKYSLFTDAQGGEEGAYQREVSGQNIAPQRVDTALMQAAFLSEEMEADTEYAW